MSDLRVVVGGGAAGFFAAIRCAEKTGGNVLILEKTAQFLGKVRISGGGRCNVTHACDDPGNLAGFYPRGGPALKGPFRLFGPADTLQWFEQRGVKLKTEPDGRMFPVTDHSETIIDCLMAAAREAGVEWRTNCGVDTVTVKPNGKFQLRLSRGESLICNRLMLATGGCRAPAAAALAISLGHHIEPPVPSLFTFRIAVPWLREISGIVVDPAEVSVASARLRERGPVLITHEGLSGPAILRLSAWGARAMHDAAYRFPLKVNWVPGLDEPELIHILESRRLKEPSRLVVNSSIPGLAQRLWERLVLAAGIRRETRWAALSRSHRHTLIRQLMDTELPVTGKSLNAEEFVTCGGVSLGEVNFKTMESRICPSLFFGGELLDIDGLTGGFNFQAAWTTGWLAGTAM